MKLKRFNELNEDIKHKNINEMIDEVLDKLSLKKKLSMSEKEFMKEASTNTVKDITVPSLSGDFMKDAANPHNVGIMWIGKDNVWKQLKSVEEEEDEKLESEETDDQTWKRKKKRETHKYKEELPGLTKTINEWAIIVKEFTNQRYIYYNKLMELAKDKDSDYKYQYEQKIDYATNGTLESLFNQFGPIITSIKEDDDE